jgi:hypothetical protein
MKLLISPSILRSPQSCAPEWLREPKRSSPPRGKHGQSQKPIHRRLNLKSLILKGKISRLEGLRRGEPGEMFKRLQIDQIPRRLAAL